jgi:curved DNA-binding protein CbpA
MRNDFLNEILEISPAARLGVIKAAYRRLFQQYHPDRNLLYPGAEASMSMINRA